LQRFVEIFKSFLQIVLTIIREPTAIVLWSEIGLELDSFVAIPETALSVSVRDRWTRKPYK